jgi:hypothetical protein
MSMVPKEGVGKKYALPKGMMEKITKSSEALLTTKP